jgi:hypothetical protein
MTIEVKQKISQEVLEDIFVTALEGGSNYWYFLSEEAVKLIRDAVPKSEDPHLSTSILKAILKGVEVPINDADNEDDVIGTISLNTMEERLQKLADSQNKSALIRHIEEEGDADSADTVFQYLAFGEIVYG